MTGGILITGGNGMVGSQADFGVRLSKEELNITELQSVRQAFEKYRPEAVLHLAALVNMRECQENPDLARKINIEGTQNIASLAKEFGAHVVYLSSVAVFDGEKLGQYDEGDTPHPLNVYGETKLQGERVVLESSPSNLVVRTGWLFGGGPEVDKRLIAVMFRKLRQNEPMTLTADRVLQPTYVPDLLETIHEAIEKRTAGILHVANSGPAVSYYEVGEIIKELCSFSTPIERGTSVELDPTGVTRAKNEGMTSKYITLRPWKNALSEYLLGKQS